MSKNDESPGPLGGWFGTIGAFAGIGLALSVGAEMEPKGLAILAFIFMVIGGWIGIAVEHVVVRLLIILVVLIEFSARHAIWATIKSVFFSGM